METEIKLQRVKLKAARFGRPFRFLDGPNKDIWHIEPPSGWLVGRHIEGGKTLVRIENAEGSFQWIDWETVVEMTEGNDILLWS